MNAPEPKTITCITCEVPKAPAFFYRREAGRRDKDCIQCRRQKMNEAKVVQEPRQTASERFDMKGHQREFTMRPTASGGLPLRWVCV